MGARGLPAGTDRPGSYWIGGLVRAASAFNKACRVSDGRLKTAQNLLTIAEGSGIPATQDEWAELQEMVKQVQWIVEYMGVEHNG